MSPSLSILQRVACTSGPLTTADVLPRALYQRMRPAALRAGRALRERRRVALGAHGSLTFESRATAWLQVHEELCFVSRDELGATLELLRLYNQRIPPPGELRATLHIEADDRWSARALAPHLARVQLRLGATTLRAEPLEPLGALLPGVACLRFAQVSPAAGGAPPRVQWDAPGHQVDAPLPPALARRLRQECLDAPLPRGLFNGPPSAGARSCRRAAEG